MRPRRPPAAPPFAVLVLSLLAAAPAAAPAAAQGGPLVVFDAGSLARPLRAALDSFARRDPVTIAQESAGSLETARKLTELHRIPDIIALADREVFDRLLMPDYVESYVEFARNRMVIAYTDRSRGAATIDSANWSTVLLAPGTETGRADPSTDPNGYRTLLVLQLAERHYARPGLAARLLAAMPARNVRPNEATLIGLLQAGEFDYIWSYESLAQAAHVRYLTLPPAIDLSDPALADRYAEAAVTVRGAGGTDSVTFRGAPIVYAIAIPVGAPHRAAAERFLAWLTSPEGVRVLRAARLDALEHPVTVSARPTR
ncbi:MAG TPA: extracellular solute-binding protein [Gemmatimonadaceae bacterium]|nr:extracellular solute-binding protein [Gemmatimonadaceae bacterium]